MFGRSAAIACFNTHTNAGARATNVMCVFFVRLNIQLLANIVVVVVVVPADAAASAGVFQFIELELAGVAPNLPQNDSRRFCCLRRAATPAIAYT